MTRHVSKRQKLPPAQNPEAAYEWYAKGPLFTKSRGWCRWGMRKDFRYFYEVWGNTRAQALQQARKAQNALGGL